MSKYQKHQETFREIKQAIPLGTMGCVLDNPALPGQTREIFAIHRVIEDARKIAEKKDSSREMNEVLATNFSRDFAELFAPALSGQTNWLAGKEGPVRNKIGEILFKTAQCSSLMQKECLKEAIESGLLQSGADPDEFTASLVGEGFSHHADSQ